MKRHLDLLVLITMAIVMMTVGCGPSTTSSPPTSAPTATSTPSFPIGVFTKGPWIWEFRADGDYNLKNSGADLVVDGSYTVTGDEITFQDDYFPCKDIVATYTWVYDGTALSFTVLDDICAERKNSSYGNWVIKP